VGVLGAAAAGGAQGLAIAERRTSAKPRTPCVRSRNRVGRRALVATTGPPEREGQQPWFLRAFQTVGRGSTSPRRRSMGWRRGAGQLRGQPPGEARTLGNMVLAGHRAQRDDGAVKTAAVVVIGDEILSGKADEVNARFLIGELRALGVQLR